MQIEKIRQKLSALSDKNRAQHSKAYLKSDYDFYGLSVPELRKIAKVIKEENKLGIYDAYNLFDELWNSGNHEEMSLGLYLLGLFMKNYNLEMWNFLFKEDQERKVRVEKARSWDHIDELGTHLLGEIFEANPILQNEVKKLSESRNPWMRRLSIVMQYPSIKKGKIQLTLLLAEKLVYDEDIYVQKGAGWMLREAGKKNPQAIESFIKIHKNMKAFAFSYATEKMLHLRKLLKNERDEHKKGLRERKKGIKSSDLENIKHFKN